MLSIPARPQKLLLILLFGLTTELSTPNGYFNEPLLSLAALFFLGLLAKEWTAVAVGRALTGGILVSLTFSYFTFGPAITGIHNLSGAEGLSLYLLFAGFIILQSLPLVAMAFFMQRLGNVSGKPVTSLVTAAAYTLCIYVVWQLVPGHSIILLVDYPVLVQTGRLGGWPLVSFIVSYFCFSAAYAFTRKGRVDWNHFFAATLILWVAAGYGYWFISDYQSEKEKAGPGQFLRVGFVQPNVTHKERRLYERVVAESIETGKPPLVSRLYDRYFQESLKLAKEQGPLDVLVWAESPIPFSFIDNKKRFLDLQSKTGATLVANITGKLYNGEDFNSTMVLSPQGKVTGYYNKRNLLPFVAYVPLAEYFPALNDLFGFAGNYKPGTKTPVLKLNENVQMIPAICFDSIFVEHIRDFVETGGEIMIEQSNDTLFGTTGGAQGHVSTVQFRAIEFNIPVVRATNSGISAYIHASGEMPEEGLTRLETADAGVYNVYIPRERSFYAWAGDWILWLCGLILLGRLTGPGILSRILRKR